MKRAEAKKEYTWDLSQIFDSHLEWEKEFSKTKLLIQELSGFKGKLFMPEICLKLLRTADEACLMQERLTVYANMYMHTDGANSEAVALAQRADTLSASLMAALSFIRPELTQLSDEQLDGMIESIEFIDYAYTLSLIKKKKAHVLSEKEEYVLARLSEVTGSFRDIFEKIDSVDMPHPKIKVDGERIPLTHGAYMKLLQHPSGAVRKKAFSQYYTLFEERINTLAALYTASVKRNNISAALRGFGGAMEASIFSDDVPPGVYQRLIRAVEDELPVLHDYVAYRKSVLGELHMYDMHVPLIKGAELGTDYESAYKIVLEALEPLGSEYISRLKKMKSERRIDVMENDGKRGGAYCWGAYGSGPFVLLNYAGTTHDIFTISHELGHAMHSLYSDEAQCYNNAGYSIFVAEVASTTNEVLLLKHLIAKERRPETKRFLLSYYLDMFRTTLFRQTMFAEFENAVHVQQAKGEALTAQSLSKLYLKLNKKYYGKNVIHDKQIKYEWARIPHFYSAFYVYKYATGITAAVSLASSILAGGRERYFDKFLRAGGSKSPYEILKDAGVDLMTDAPYIAAMREFKGALEELRRT